MDAVEGFVPTTSQVMGTIDLLKQFARAHEGGVDTLVSLARYENGVLPLLTKRA